MSKQKSSAVIRVADGAGGMRAVSDHRFDTDHWPIEFVVPANDASTWMAHLHAESHDRGWGASGLSQIDAAENSGTWSLHTTGGPDPPTLHIVWERPRNGSLHVKARPDGRPPLSLELARAFIEAVNERVRKRVMARDHRRELLAYSGLPWRGELWLTDDLRLGPPSLFPDSLIGPQVVIVDAMVDGIGPAGITANFETLLTELRVFLGVLLGISPARVRPAFGWVTELDDQYRLTNCTLRWVGYSEIGAPSAFPDQSTSAPIAREAVTRPGLGRLGIYPDMNQQWVPSDIEALWRSFKSLAAEPRNTFLRAGNAYLVGRSMWPDQRTAYAAFLVVACEALKPRGSRYDGMNIYDVVASVVGIADAQRLRDLALHPQKVRSDHLHRGELLSDELLTMVMYDDFRDPSFGEMLDDLTLTCRICLIEWLRRGGKFTAVFLPR
jgi:hypothetical protein